MNKIIYKKNPTDMDKVVSQCVSDTLRYIAPIL